MARVSPKPVYWDETGSRIVRTENDGSYATIETGGSVTIPATSYASNAEAVAALGVGKLYRSTQTVAGSPIILITV